MGHWDYSNAYPPYVRVGDRKKVNEKCVAKLRKKNANIRPVHVEGRTIAKSWWGKSWNKNLERYADYEYRLDRGRSYVRHGSVLDLQISDGLITSTVSGSNNYNYTIKIKIAPLDEVRMNAIVSQTKEQLASLNILLTGTFPEDLKELFFNEKNGLFPTPSEISFDCNCPDYADMCKHIAATLYGVGARLDDDPSLFFTLRNIDQNAFIHEAVVSQTDDLIAKAQTASSGRRRRMSGTDVSTVFGLEMQDAPAPQNDVASRTKPAATKKKTTKKKTTSKKTAKKKRTI